MLKFSPQNAPANTAPTVPTTTPTSAAVGNRRPSALLLPSEEAPEELLELELALDEFVAAADVFDLTMSVVADSLYMSFSGNPMQDPIDSSCDGDMSVKLFVQ